jgi:hypothetical protein
MILKVRKPDQDRWLGILKCNPEEQEDGEAEIAYGRLNYCSKLNKEEADCIAFSWEEWGWIVQGDFRW